MLILHVDDIAGHAVCVPTLGGAIEDAIGRRCRASWAMSRGAHGSVTVTTVTGALSCLARASPCSRAFVASSEPSVAIRICLYIDGPRRHCQSIMHEGGRGTRALL